MSQTQTTTIKQRNTRYFTDENIAADNVLYTMECLDVISTNMKNKVNNIILVILSNLIANLDTIDESIEEVRNIFNVTNIFNKEFTENLFRDIESAKKYELTKRN